MDFSTAKDGAEGQWENDGFVLTGAGWTGLVSDLLGPWQAGDSSHSAVAPTATQAAWSVCSRVLEGRCAPPTGANSNTPSQSIKLEEMAGEHEPA
jgi:hypothetical protein